MDAKDERQYPEHLNPFHKTRNGLSQSFRGLKKSIFGSFRRKGKEARPEIRKHTETLPQTRHTVSVIPKVQVSEYTPLPRSRFSERLSKSPNPYPKPRQWHSNESVAKNPFDDEEKKQEIVNEANESNMAEAPPVPAERKKLKKRKKRAPIPPNGVHDDPQYLNVPSNVSHSKWSLTSTDTEFSSTCYSESEIDYTYAELTKNEEILQITKEIEKFTDDSNNNFIISNNSMEVNGDGGNYVITQTTETIIQMEVTGTDPPNIEPSVQITEINEEDTASGAVKEDNKAELNTHPTKNEYTVTELCTYSPTPKNKDTVEIVEVNESGFKDETNDDETQLRTENKNIEEVLEPIATFTFNDRPDSESTNAEMSSNIHSFSSDAVKDIDVDCQNNNNFDIQSELNEQNTKHENFQLTYFESQSIFIKGSRDDLDHNHILYNERASLFITGSTDELDKSNADSAFKEKIQYFEDRSPTKHERSPIFKVRKNILSKEKLLGSDSS